jgi:bacterioferritin-associated ferredoxin
MLVRAELQGGDWIQMSHSGSEWHVEARGSLRLLDEAQRLRSLLPKDPRTWPVPELPDSQVQDPVILLVRELILKLQNKWTFPFEDRELCHCRAIPTTHVDSAIVATACTVDRVTRLTNAGSACGTCKPDIEKIIHYRRG